MYELLAWPPPYQRHTTVIRLYQSGEYLSEAPDIFRDHRLPGQKAGELVRLASAAWRTEDQLGRSRRKKILLPCGNGGIGGGSGTTWASGAPEPHRWILPG